MKTWRILIDQLQPNQERFTRVKSTGRRLIFGRSRMCDVRVPIPEISRYHCALVVNDDGTVVAEDLGSGSGSFYDGAKFSTRAIEPAKILLLGTVEVCLAAPPELLHDKNPEFRLSLVLEKNDGTLLARDVFDVQTGDRIAVGNTPHGFRLPWSVQDADQFFLEVGARGSIQIVPAKEAPPQPAGEVVAVGPDASLNIKVDLW